LIVMRKPQVLLADNHRLFREALAKLLEPEFDIVDQVDDGLTLVTAAVRLRPDIILLGIALPLLNGVDAGRRIRRTQPEVRLVYLTANEDRDVAIEAMRAGASGYVLKRSGIDELVTALRAAMGGQRYITALLGGGIVEASQLSVSLSRLKQDAIARQLSVLQLLVDGHSVKGIAGLLDLSARKVASHKDALMRRLGIMSHAELIRHGVRVMQRKDLGI
jgi:DNA-binding NarL/FixJ family response regulator